MKDNIRIEDTIAYKLGFEHGLKEGVDNNTFENDYEINFTPPPPLLGRQV